MELLKTLYSRWCKINDKIRFLLVGSANAGISFVVFALCVLILTEQHHQLCVTLQWVISSIFSYFNQKFFVFCTKGNYVKEYIKCCSTWAIGYVLNAILIELFLKIYDNVLVIQPIIILIVSIFTYVLFKYFAFKK